MFKLETNGVQSDTCNKLAGIGLVMLSLATATAAHADDDADQKKLVASCKASRLPRLGEMKKAVRAEIAMMSKARGHLSWILKHCKIDGDTSVACDTKPAPGLEGSTIAWVLRLDPHARIYTGKFTHENEVCETPDTDAGFDFFLKTRADFEDSSEIDAILAK